MEESASFIMSCYSKEKLERNDPVTSNKNHLSRSERDMYRVCPSKLSKRELEDLYFTLLENNLELKKTVNGQQDKIRVLSTQVQRMTTNQERLVNKEIKECCTSTKAYVNEQKDFITELKETNQRMADRIQQLTLRLSSAKQFQKTTPAQVATARANTPFRVATLTPKKHDCIHKAHEAPPPISPSSILKLSTYSQWEDKSPKKSTQTQISVSSKKSSNSDEPCDRNKCKTLMEELKLKVVTLQEELTYVHDEYSVRISRLETEVSDVRNENVRISGERTASQHELQNTVRQNSDILAKFRSSEAKCAELAAQLAIEKRKVAELDTLLKAAEMSEKVQKTLEEHLITITNWLPGLSKQKEVEDAVRKSSPTKYMPSKCSSSTSKAIKIVKESPTKTRSKESSCESTCISQTTSNAVTSSTVTEDRQKQEHPNPPPKDVTTRFEDRKNQENPPNPPTKDLSPLREERQKQESSPYPPPKDLSPLREERQKNVNSPYPPPKDLSPRPEERKKNVNSPYPPPKDLSPQPEERQKRENSAYPPPKDMSPRPEERQKRENSPYSPPKDLSPRPEERQKRENSPYPPPKDLSPRPEERQKHEYPPYPPSERSSPRKEERQKREHSSDPPTKNLSPQPEQPKKHDCQSPRNLSPQPENRMKLGFPSSSPKAMSPVPKVTSSRAEDRRNLGYSPYPPKPLHPQLEDRTNLGYPFPDPKYSSTPSAGRECYEGACAKKLPKPPKIVKCDSCGCVPHIVKIDSCECLPPHVIKRNICRCPAWVQMPMPIRKHPSPPQDECSSCCFPEHSAMSTNDKVNSSRGVCTRNSLKKEIDYIKSKLQNNTPPGVEPHDDSDDLAIIKQNKDLLIKILELQNQVEKMNKGTCQVKEAKRNKLTEIAGSPTVSTNPTAPPTLPKSPEPLLSDLPKANESPEVKLSRRASVDSPPLFEQSQEDHLKRLQCCKTDQSGATESPSKNDKCQQGSSRGARTRFTPTRDNDDTKSTNVTDDSGYQESDETGLQKMNKELLVKILDLQNQVDSMKIMMDQMAEAQSDKPGECRETATKYTDPPTASEALESKLVSHSSVESATVTVNSPPSLYCKSQPPSENEESLPFQPKESVERICRLNRQKLEIEVLGNPKGSETAQPLTKTLSSDETRARTVQGYNGTLEITEDRSSSNSDEYIVNYDSKTEQNTPKLTITEKKKLVSADCVPTDAVSMKSGMGPRLSLNPEKLKYLENEGIEVSEVDLEHNMVKLKVGSESIMESIPSNPELGFGIPRLTNKTRRKRSVLDSKHLKKPPAAVCPDPQTVRNDYSEKLPSKLKFNTTESLAGDHPTELRQTDETKKEEDCEYCAACSFDKECELKHEKGLNPTINKQARGIQKKQFEDPDLCNTSQSPDAIPPTDDKKKDMKKNVLCNLLNDMNRKQNKECLASDEILERKKAHAQKTITTTDEPVHRVDGPLPDQRDIGTTNSFIQPDSNKAANNIMQKRQKLVPKPKREDVLIDGPIIYAKQTYDAEVGSVILKDVPLLGKRKFIKNTTDADQETLMSEVTTPSANIPPLSERVTTVLQSDVAQNLEQKVPEKVTRAITTTTEKADTARVGIKVLGQEPDVSMYRRASGTFRYRFVLENQDVSVCNCPGQVDGYCTDHSKIKGVQIHGDEAKLGPSKYRRRQSILDVETYREGMSRAETTDTDLEMSYLSDLPLEMEKKSPGKTRPLSPGENRMATDTTSTHSDYSRRTAGGHSLSEGEMLAGTSIHSASIIEKPYINPTLAHKLETPPSHQMETALNAITDELQRCKNLLNTSRYVEHSHPSAQLSLKAAPATQGIGDAHAPMSVFTLHIGTIVLNDEAVLHSRNKNLVLKWKFYNQPVTMARIRAGRVIVFDFSTQYDIKITEDFLNYLKHKEMPVMICELDHEEQPFATFTIPLRDALLLANTKADMSVALIAGAQMKEARHVAELPDDVGVVDLWCMLRVDDHVVPGVFDIAQPITAPNPAQQPGVSQESLRSQNELDIAVRRSAPAASHEPTGKNQTYADVEYTRNSNPWQQETRSRSKQAPETESSQTDTEPPPFDVSDNITTVCSETVSSIASKYPAIRERSPVSHSLASSKPFASIVSATSDVPEDKRRESPLIVSEVDAKIRRPKDIVYAAGKNRRNDSRSRLYRSDDEITSQLHSSFGSLRSVLNRLQKRGSRITLNSYGGERRNFIEKLRKASTTDRQTRPHKKQPNNMEMYKKYENVAKMGLNKAEQSKKVTIQNERSDMEFDQAQKDAHDPKEKKTLQPSLPKVEITVLWLALNEECEAMLDPHVQRVYVAYTFLGRAGAELETPVSLPKPKNYVEKCYFNFKKTFELEDTDIPKVGHMARCRAGSSLSVDDKDCIVFSVVSEPAEDPLGIESCIDIGYALLYLGDLLTYSAGSPEYTEVVRVRAVGGAAPVCGVLAVRLGGLDVVRRCLLMTDNQKPVRPS